MIDLVHPYETRRELEHVVAKRDDDELRVLGSLFDVASDDGDLTRSLACGD